MSKNLKIGITAGDPAGIGPEVAIHAIRDLHNPSITPVLIGNASYFHKYFPNLANFLKVQDVFVTEPETGKKYLHNVSSSFPAPVLGQGSEYTGAESKLYIDTALDLWKQGVIDAIVTGPVNKSYIEKSGTPFTGHTEYIAHYIGENSPYMMMYSDHYRVLLVSTHMPVAKVAAFITSEKIRDTIITGHSSIKAIDGKEPKIAITGLDPHCGDDGAIGDFDKTVTAKVVNDMQSNGIAIEGPFAADTLFIADTWKKYDLVIAHYHDQGLIPFKMLAFDTGVNVTLGLSLTRTSVDHGTAYDIAGKNCAGYQSMLEAIKLAYRLENGKPIYPGPCPGLAPCG